MEKYKEIKKISRKRYNSDKTYIQVSNSLHKKIQEYCLNNNLKMKDFISHSLEKSIKD